MLCLHLHVTLHSEIEAVYKAAAARTDKLRTEQHRSRLVTGIASQRIALLSFEESVAQQWALLQVSAMTNICYILYCIV
jgi:hypothetical protein